MAKIQILRSGQSIGTVLIASLILSACSSSEPSGMAGGMPPAPVQIQEISDSTLRNTSDYLGALEAQRRVVLRPEVEGRIVEILVSPGQTVQSGEVIAQVKADQEQAQVRGAGADLAAARAARNTAAAQLSAAEAERDRAAANVELQNVEFQRTQTLVAEGAQSQQNLDRARNQRDTAIAALRAAQQEVDAAQAALKEADAQIARSQADQAVARENLQDYRVIAPIAGVVGDIPVKIGDYVDTGDTLTSIIQNQTLELELNIPVEYLDQLQIGMPVELLGAEEKVLVTGRISFISPQVNNNSQLILAKASFQNNGSLKDGQYVRARVIWDTSSGVLIPTSAVTRVAGESFVFVAEQGEPSPSGEPQQVAKQRAVKLGPIQGNSYQVISGIEPGDKVIVSGILNLSDGVPIAPEAPASGQEAPGRTTSESSNSQ